MQPFVSFNSTHTDLHIQRHFSEYIQSCTDSWIRRPYFCIQKSKKNSCAIRHFHTRLCLQKDEYNGYPKKKRLQCTYMSLLSCWYIQFQWRTYLCSLLALFDNLVDIHIENFLECYDIFCLCHKCFDSRYIRRYPDCNWSLSNLACRHSPLWGHTCPSRPRIDTFYYTPLRNMEQHILQIQCTEIHYLKYLALEAFK